MKSSNNEKYYKNNRNNHIITTHNLVLKINFHFNANIKSIKP